MGKLRPGQNFGRPTTQLRPARLPAFPPPRLTQAQTHLGSRAGSPRHAGLQGLQAAGGPRSHARRRPTSRRSPGSRAPAASFPSPRGRPCPLRAPLQRAGPTGCAALPGAGAATQPGPARPDLTRPLRRAPVGPWALARGGSPQGDPGTTGDAGKESSPATTLSLMRSAASLIWGFPALSWHLSDAALKIRQAFTLS